MLDVSSEYFFKGALYQRSVIKGQTRQARGDCK